MLCAAIVVTFLCAFDPVFGVADSAPGFEKDIKPIFEKHCLSCHSSQVHTSGLVLDSLDSIVRGGTVHGPAIIPGNSSASLMVKYLRGEKKPSMPLGSAALPEEPIALIEKWINQLQAPGKEEGAARQNQHPWPFRQLQAPTIPELKQKGWVRNPVDAFVLARLEEKGLQPAPPASKRILLRRLYFDLIGLPPTPEAMNQFLANPAPDAYEQEIEKLLSDPRYGERWARHWLDLVRYGDSEGAGEDMPRPHMWRYRDYVIRAFNQDRPYDRFIREQIAGDVYSGAEGKLGLGFINLVVRGEDTRRRDLLIDAVDTTGSVFLGLTLACARCHDHKYDPIPQRDYYRMEAFFAGMVIGPTDVPFTQYEMQHQNPEAWKNQAQSWDQIISKRQELQNRTTAEFKQRIKKNRLLLSGHDPKDGMADVHDRALKRILKEGLLFSQKEQDLYELIERQNFPYGTPSHPDFYRPKAYSVWETVQLTHPDIPTTYVLAAGDSNSKGEAVDPGFLSAVTGHSDPVEINPFQGPRARRKLLADWLASRDNPLTARVMVNRIWQHHFGRGLVLTPNDFGKNGSGTVHPELIDALASQFIENGWSVKVIHRLILQSNVYRQSIQNPQHEQYEKVDSDNRYYWRWNPLRLEAEVIRDNVLSVSGELNSTQGGPGFLPDLDDELLKARGTWWEPAPQAERNRRTIYMWQLRSFQFPLVSVFDGADMGQSCAAREVTNTTPQVFALFNNQFVHEQSHKMAQRISRELGQDAGAQVERTFQLAFQRLPTLVEKAKCLAFLGYPRPDPHQFATALMPVTPADSKSNTLPDLRQPVARKASLSDLCLVLLNMNEFVYLE